ncbi:unnamed protein product [Clavelina lepadiformis]|uniref:EF-hand domain-containing protein n=1 Tax=Clavelina lepadiformis TaxID=159417 RepID=A0ABP0GRC5_CLALP
MEPKDLNVRKMSICILRRTSLPENQLETMHAVFHLFDQDRDGYINPDELKRALEASGYHLTDNELDEIIKEVDRNGDGKIDFAEFTRLTNARMKPKDEEFDDDQHYENAFKVFDKDGNGFIDRDELREVVRSITGDPTEEELDKLFEEADLNGDGRIDFKEFMQALTTF